MTEITLKELILKVRNWFAAILSKWVYIILFAILGGVLGFTYAFFKKPVYVAKTTFVLEDEKSSGGLANLAGLASIAGVDFGGSGGGIFQGDNILNLYKSRSMLQRTLLTEVVKEGEKHLLVDLYVDFKYLRKKWVYNPDLVSLKFVNQENALMKPNRLRDSVLGTIVSDLNKEYLSLIKPDKKLSTIEVEIQAEDEFFAKTFNEQLVKNVNEFYTTTKTKKTLKNVQILQHKTDSVRSVMNGSIYSAVAVADATPNLNPTRQVQRSAPASRAQFSAETNKSILAEMVKNLELAKIALLREVPLIQIIDQPIFPLEKNKVGKIKATLLGSLMFGFCCVLFLTLKMFYKSIINE